MKSKTKKFVYVRGSISGDLPIEGQKEFVKEEFHYIKVEISNLIGYYNRDGFLTKNLEEATAFSPETAAKFVNQIRKYIKSNSVIVFTSTCKPLTPIVKSIKECKLRTLFAPVYIIIRENGKTFYYNKAGIVSTDNAEASIFLKGVAIKVKKILNARVDNVSLQPSKSVPYEALVDTETGCKTDKLIWRE